MDKTKEKFVELACSQGVSISEVKQFFNVMNPHPGLIEMPRMVVGLLNSLDAAEKPPVVLAEDFDIRVIRKVCNWIISVKDYPGIEKTLGDRFLPVKLLKSSGAVNPVKHKTPGLKDFEIGRASCRERVKI